MITGGVSRPRMIESAQSTTSVTPRPFMTDGVATEGLDLARHAKSLRFESSGV
jgi:hypothetical protein